MYEYTNNRIYWYIDIDTSQTKSEQPIEMGIVNMDTGSIAVWKQHWVCVLFLVSIEQTHKAALSVRFFNWKKQQNTHTVLPSDVLFQVKNAHTQCGFQLNKITVYCFQLKWVWWIWILEALRFGSVPMADITINQWFNCNDLSTNQSIN